MFILLNQVPSAASLLFFFRRLIWKIELISIALAPLFLCFSSSRLKLSPKILLHLAEESINPSRVLRLRISTKLLNLMALGRYHVMFVFRYVKREKEGCWTISMTTNINFPSLKIKPMRCCTETCGSQYKNRSSESQYRNVFIYRCFIP